MTKSESIAKLAEALAKAQGKIRGAIKDATNPHFRTNYADLASVWEACRAALSENGLAVIQTTASNEPKRITVDTTLAHSSGEWISGSLTMTPQQDTPQGIGSCITYARRYALSSMVGVAPTDDIPDAGDDDGEAAEGRDAGDAPAESKPTSRLDAVKGHVAAQTKGTPAQRKERLKARMTKLGFEVAAQFAWVEKVLGKKAPENSADLDKLEAAAADLEKGREELGAVAVN